MIRGKLIAMLLACTCFQMAAQDVTQPLPPVLENVTVDPETGFALLHWLPGGSSDVGSYVIYTYDNSTAFAIDTLFSPFVTSYIHTASAARFRSVNYVVAAMDSSLNISPLSNSLSTIYLSAVNDSCRKKIDLSWTGYLNALHPCNGYAVWIIAGGGPAGLLKVLPETVHSYSYTDYLPGTLYCFNIVAVDNENNLSSSNRLCVTSGREALPLWTSVTAVSVADGNITVTGQYDINAETYEFIAERLTDGGSWVTVAAGDGSAGEVVMTGIPADTSKISLYRIAAVNNCGVAVTPSAPVRNIVITAVSQGPVVIMRWNSPFPDDAAAFSILRDAGQGPAVAAHLLSDTLWTDDYRSYAYDVTRGEIIYRVAAVRSAAPAGTTPCVSNAAAVGAIENIHVANSFTPNGDGLNDTFAPVLSFTPASYELKIFSRGGALLFTTASHGTGWDGTRSGTPQPAGAYLWTMSLTTPSGRTEKRSGTVTILP